MRRFVVEFKDKDADESAWVDIKDPYIAEDGLETQEEAEEYLEYMRDNPLNDHVIYRVTRCDPPRESEAR